MRRFVQVSTDEVYGSLGPTGAFEETTPLSPRSPYSASKAAADHFVMAFHHTHGMDVVITRCSNNYGPYQFPEKLIPLMILNAFDGKPLPVYGDGLYVRDWIHVEDHCEAIDAGARARRAPARSTTSAPRTSARTSTSCARSCASPGRDESLIRHVPDRPGHDRRYAMNAAQDPRASWAGARATTSTRGWPTPSPGTAPTAPGAERVRSGAYRDYYDQQYARAPARGAGSGE